MKMEIVLTEKEIKKMTAKDKAVMEKKVNLINVIFVLKSINF